MNKGTGLILHDYTLDAIFYANIAIVGNYVMFGTGYGFGTGNGSFQVWELKK